MLYVLDLDFFVISCLFQAYCVNDDLSCSSWLVTNRFHLDFNREKNPRSRLKRTQSASGKTENCRSNKKRRRGN